MCVPMGNQPTIPKPRCGVGFFSCLTVVRFICSYANLCVVRNDRKHVGFMTKVAKNSKERKEEREKKMFGAPSHACWAGIDSSLRASPPPFLVIRP